ncbi:hypothetical protein BDZ89DRAFT_593971 [Hymenopellis radicata]|nr:hypothetical protein BDZ89DRAFT_593971 [Hymenopellis radicata]
MPATIQSSGEQSPLDNTMGAMLVGVILSAVLYGVSIVQTLYYYTRYPKDPWYLKLLVATTIFFDTVHQAFITHTMYHYLIVKFYEPTALTEIIWSVILESIPTGVTGSLVQCFYTVRVFRLSKKNYILTGTILLLILANSGSGTAWVVLSMTKSTYGGLLEISALTMTINALSAATDILIAISLCLMLHKSRTGFKSSDTMITRLTLFFMNTGLLTSLCAVGALISLAVSPDSLIYALWYFCIGRLYANSLLAALNARNIIRGRTEDVDLVEFPTAIVSPLPTSHGSSNGRTPNISIRIDTTKEYDADMPLDDRKDTGSMMKASPASDTTYIGEEHC